MSSDRSVQISDLGLVLTSLNTFIMHVGYGATIWPSEDIPILN